MKPSIYLYKDFIENPQQLFQELHYTENPLLDLLSPLFSLAPETLITVVFTDGDYIENEPSNIATLIKDMHIFDDMKYNIDWYIDGVYL